MELPKLMEMTILAMRACEDEVNAEMKKMERKLNSFHSPKI